MSLYSNRPRNKVFVSQVSMVLREKPVVYSIRRWWSFSKTSKTRRTFWNKNWTK